MKFFIKKYSKNLIIILTFLIVAKSTYAGFVGDIHFSTEEVKVHQENIQSLVSEASLCLRADLERQQEFYKKYNISAFYGENSKYAHLSLDGKKKYIRDRNLNESLVHEILPTTCVGLALKCLNLGLMKTHQDEVLTKIKIFLRENDVDGQALQYALSKLGWKIYYWNPNPAKNKLWDFEEKIADPRNKKHFRGFHEENFLAVQNKQRYYFNHVDDSFSLVGFKESVPSFLASIPFFIGSAHMGYHVFPGLNGNVIEAHSTRDLSDENTIESAPFNPLASDGAPSGRYRSGIMSLPPL